MQAWKKESACASKSLRLEPQTPERLHKFVCVCAQVSGKQERGCRCIQCPETRTQNTRNVKVLRPLSQVQARKRPQVCRRPRNQNPKPPKCYVRARACAQVSAVGCAQVSACASE